MPNLYDEYYRGKYLPHQLPLGATFAITYRLKGSIPMAVIAEYRVAYELELEALKKKYLNTNSSNLKEEVYVLQAKTYLKYDKYLDTNANGPYHLSMDGIAQIVVDSLLYLEEKYGEIQAYCIMSNHVHLLFKSRFVAADEFGQQNNLSMTSFMERHKGYTGLLANRYLQKETNSSFWAEESYDHRIRNEKSFYRNLNYILQNPVKAGLVQDWRDWKFAYCKPELQQYISVTGTL